VHARAERWLQTVPGLGHRELQVSYARSELYDATVAEAAGALDVLSVAAEEGHIPSRDVLGAFVPVLVDNEHIQHVWAIRTTALASDFLAASRLLRGSTPDGYLLDARAEGMVIERADGRPLTLGERRALARRPTRAHIDRLMRDPHPMVASILLKNPRITEEDVVRMAAFRPANPLVQIQIGKTWSHHKRVRRTIVLNPSSPPAVAVPMLSLLVRPELLEASRAADLPAVIRATALELWELRPPMPPAERPELPH
jgi:hypothetical protein